MPTQIIDLDEFLGDDKRVRVKGETYVLPPDLPAELYLKVQKLAQSNASEPEMIEALYDELLELFRYKRPALKSLPLTISQVVFGIARIYGDGSAGEGEQRPPRRNSRGGATKTGRSRTTKR
jgi:hypothetical protein